MANTPTFAIPFQWDTTKTYEINHVVFNQGKTYTALQAVPANTAITNTSYWAETGARIGLINKNSNDISVINTDIDAVEENIDNMLVSLYTPPASA